MENKLNEKAISDYIDQFSTAALDSMYKDKEFISGGDILATPVKQVGLLALSGIFDSWKQESKKLESPFFDYSGAQVQDLMLKLMNTLSNNINVSRIDFEPLFKKATQDALMLMFSPYDFYRALVESADAAEDGRTLLKEKKKFIKINSELLVALIDKTELDGGVSTADVDALFSGGDILPEDTDKLIANCSEVVPLSTEILYVEIQDEAIDQNNEEVDVAPEPVEQESTEEPKGPEAPLVNDQDVDDDHLVENTFFVPGEISTVNEQFTAEPQETLADTLAKEQKGNLKSMLSINQKFMFINDLFDGNQEDFLKVIEFLDDCGSEQDAINFVQNNYIKRSLWREESPAVKEFIKLITVRFN